MEYSTAIKKDDLDSHKLIRKYIFFFKLNTTVYIQL